MDSLLEFKVSKKRWMILFVYGFLNIANSQLWVSFSPISDLTEDFFSHLGGATAVNMLAVTYSVMYLPGTVLGALSIKRMDIRGALLLVTMTSSSLQDSHPRNLHSIFLN